MFGRRALIYVGVIVLSCLFAGCGIRPQTDFYMRPIAAGEEYRIDAETSSVTMEIEDISITISALDTLALLGVTSDPYINPYVYISDWGVARPRYTVFDVTVRNTGESEFPSLKLSNAVLMDDHGEQYEAISYEELMERYAAYPRLEREVIYYPSPRVYYRPRYHRSEWWPHPWYYHYDRYWGSRPYYVRKVYAVPYFRRAILKGTMYREVRLYPGGKRQGFLVFPLVSPDASELKIIFPNITGKEGKKIEFHFQRIPAAKD